MRGWADFIVEAFNKPGSRHIRLALSLLFISLMTAIVMILFSAVKIILHPDITLWETQVYTIIFISVMAPTIALFVLLRFEKLYGKVAKDNMERERAEEALCRSEAKYRTLFDSIDVGFCIIEMIYDTGGKPVDYRFLEVNPAFEKQTGLSDATGKRMRELVPAHEEHWFETYGNIVATGKPRRFINAAKPLMGGWYDVYAFQIGGRKSNHVAILFNDITERKRIEEALRESEERYRSLFEHMLNGFAYCKMLYDDHGNPEDYIYLAVNSAFGKLTGLENVTGKRATEAVPGIKEAHPEVFEIYGRVARTGKPEQFEIDFKPFASWLSISVYSTGQGYFTAVFDNITERKRAEDALRESEAQYRELVENANSIILRLDRDGNITFFNEFAQRFFGYAEEEILGRNVRGTIIPATDSAGRDLDAMLDDLLRHPEEYRTNAHQNMRKNGELVWVSWTNKAIYDNEGNLAGLLCVGNDITRLKQAEESLKNSETKFRTLFENARTAIFIADAETGIVVDCNSYAEDLVGRPRSEIVGVHQTVLHPADETDKYREFFSQHSRGNLIQFEAEVQNKDGRRIPVIINAAHVSIAGKDLIIGFFLDITERKRAEEERLRLVHDLQERVKEQTALYSTARIFQQEKPVAGLLQEIVEILPLALQYPGIATARITYDGEVYQSQGFQDGTWSICTNFATARGKRGAIEVFYREEMPPESEGPFLAEERDLIDSLAEMLRIYLDRKQAEEELKAAKAQAELYLDLMGHDINNMHQIALGYLELARDMHQEAGQSEFLEKPIEVLQRSARLIRNVRKLQKLKEGVFQTQVVDVCQLLVDVQREFGAVPHKAVTLNLDGCKQCHVHANELLHDVFTNLVGNAIKHTGERADIVVDLDVVWNDSRQYCQVMVEDDGPGIPDDFKGRIFNRLIESTDKAKGMGLGLYLVKSLVESYSGRVWVEDRVPGDHTKGARFVVMLPAVEK